jgi:hypothetical protein
MRPALPLTALFLLSLPLSAVAQTQRKPLQDAYVNLPRLTRVSDVKKIAARQAAESSLDPKGPKYASMPRLNPDPKTVVDDVTFEGQFRAGSDRTQLAMFSDDGCDVFIDDMEKPVLKRFAVGQHLPDVNNQSFHLLDFKFKKGKVYRIRVHYANTVYNGKTDIDGATLFGFNGGGEILETPPFRLEIVAFNDFIVPRSNRNAIRYRWSPDVPPVSVTMSIFDKQATRLRTITGLPTAFAQGQMYAEETWNGCANADGTQPLTEAGSPYTILVRGRGENGSSSSKRIVARVEEWLLDIRVEDRPGGKETLVTGPDPETITKDTLEVRVKLDEANAVESKPEFTTTGGVKVPDGPADNAWGALVTPKYIFYTTPQTPYDIRYQLVLEQQTRIFPAPEKGIPGVAVNTVLDGTKNPWDMDPTKPGRQTKGTWTFGVNSQAGQNGDRRRGLVEDYQP